MQPGDPGAFHSVGALTGHLELKQAWVMGSWGAPHSGHWQDRKIPKWMQAEWFQGTLYLGHTGRMAGAEVAIGWEAL